MQAQLPAGGSISVTRLMCVCGVVVEGTEAKLLDAVERHLAEAHPSSLPVTASAAERGLGAPLRKPEVAQLDDERSGPAA